MMIAVKQVRDSYGDSRTGCFNGGECGVIVDDIVGQKRFVAATTAKVQGRRVVQCTRSSDGSKQETVLAIPEAMFGGRQFGIEVAAPEFVGPLDGLPEDCALETRKKRSFVHGVESRQGVSSQIRRRDERRGQADACDFATPTLTIAPVRVCGSAEAPAAPRNVKTKHDT